jgi:uncharacterized protein (TIGR03437 family)
MLLRSICLSLAASSLLSGANLFQPTISPNGVVNGASYLSASFPNYGIARGSLFVVFGSGLGPADLVQATSFPLPASDGLAGTRVLISIGAYTAACPMVYTSLNQVAAIMPSNAPEGDGTLVVGYQNLTSASVPIHVVRSAFGIFTRNQAGSGPAIAQNFVSQSSMPLNTLIASATPGQTLILWGTGLGPAAGDETAGPLPGSLPYLDSLYVGGVQANVRYVGRSGCCAAVDQIVFDVPTNVAGCYVPVAAVTGGVVSNFGTISVSPSGKECDDPQSYRATDLLAAERSGAMRSGDISLARTASGDVNLSAAFFSMGLDAFLNSPGRLKPSAGSCYLSVTRVGGTTAQGGRGLNAGSAVSVTGPIGSLAAQNSGSGLYAGSMSPSQLPPGSYTVTSSGGSDVGPWSATLQIPSPAVWSNAAVYNVPAYPAAGPFTFTWTGGDPNGLVTVQLASANAIYNSLIECTASPSSGAFTIPVFLARAIYGSPATISFTYSGPATAFAASGMDAGVITASATTAAQMLLTAPAQ